MKLSQPASSSDLEVAREVARHLHEQRRQAERPAPAVAPPMRRPPAPAAPASRLDVMPSAPHAARPRQSTPERPQRPAPLAHPEPPPLPPTPPPVVASPRPVPAPPVVQRPPAVEIAPRASHERPAAPPRAHEARPVAVPTEPAPPSWDEEEQETPHAEAADALADLSAGLAETEATPTSDDDAIEIEETNTSLEEMVGAAALSAAEEIVGPADLEPGDAAVTGEAEAYEPEPAAGVYPEKPSPFDEGPSIETMSEELFDLPQTPSWGEVVENCLMIAHARGAMLIDHSGQVLASNGFWPEPGPDPIATKLVAMMEKTLKDAPTRSVSAPVGSMHLTAWRVPLAEGMITVAFLGDTPLRTEARTPVDAEILRGAP